HALEAPAAGVDVADHVPHVAVGDDDFDLHHGLQEHRGRLLGGSTEGHGAGDLEGHLRAAALGLGAVDQGDAHVHDRVARQDAPAHRFADTGLDRRDVFLGHHTADDLVDELDALAARRRLHVDEDVAVLAAPAALAHEAALDPLNRTGEGLLVGDLGPPDVGLNLELPQQPVDDDLQVQLAHALDDRLARLLVGVDAEGRVFLGQLAQGLAHLVLVGLGLRLD